MKHRSLALASLLSGLVYLIAARGVAQADPAPEDARALFEAGTEALRRGAYDESIDLLSRSHALLPNVANAFNLGVALLRAGRVVRARDLLSQLESGAFGALADEQRAAVGERMREAESTLAVLEIAVRGAANPTLRIDGVVLETEGAEARVEVDPGAHRLEVQAPGAVSETRDLEMRPGVVTNLVIELHPEPPPPVAVVEATSDDGWVWALGTTGVVLAVGGVVLGVVLGTMGPRPITDPVTGIGETLTVSTRF